MTECITCQKQTTNLKFCSRSCAAKHNNLGKQRNPPKERICVSCSATFKWRTKDRISLLCKNCRRLRDGTEITIGECREKLSVKGKHPSWVHAHVRNYCRSWNKDLTKLPCHSCGYDKHVELCHKRPVSSFPDETLLSEVNHESNIIQLCPNCHWEFDNGLLTL